MNNIIREYNQAALNYERNRSRIRNMFTFEVTRRREYANAKARYERALRRLYNAVKNVLNVSYQNFYKGAYPLPTSAWRHGPNRALLALNLARARNMPYKARVRRELGQK